VPVKRRSNRRARRSRVPTAQRLPASRFLRRMGFPARRGFTAPERLPMHSRVQPPPGGEVPATSPHTPSTLSHLLPYPFASLNSPPLAHNPAVARLNGFFYRADLSTQDNMVDLFVRPSDSIMHCAREMCGGRGKPGFENRYCPRGSGSKDGTMCPVGFYCNGVQRRPCTASTGFYCPAGASSPDGVACLAGYQVLFGPSPDCARAGIACLYLPLRSG
jgi:hypothetical protein